MEGELIGLFLSTPVPAGLSATETASRIHDQGGIVYLQHPYDTRRRALTEAGMEAIAEAVDAVEVFNGRSPAYVELLPAGPARGFRLRARVRHEEAGTGGAGDIGVYFGRSRWATAWGTEYALCAVCLNERGRPPGAKPGGRLALELRRRRPSPRFGADTNGGEDLSVALPETVFSAPAPRSGGGGGSGAEDEASSAFEGSEVAEVSEGVDVREVSEDSEDSEVSERSVHSEVAEVSEVSDSRTARISSFG